MSHAPETSLARRYSFKLLANILNIPIYLLMEAILPRALGTVAYGVYGYATGMFQYLMNLLDGGTSTCLFTNLAKRQKQQRRLLLKLSCPMCLCGLFPWPGCGPT